MKESRIGLGLMRIADLSVEEVYRLTEKCVDAGITLFDVADIYGDGKCESLLGKAIALSPHIREKMYIQSKVSIRKEPKRYDLSYEHIVKGTEEILERLGIGYLDRLLLHRPDILMDAQEIADAVGNLLKKGMIRHFGVSNFSASEIEYIKDYLPCPIEVNQVQVGIGQVDMIEQTFYTNMPSSIVNRTSDDLFFWLKKNRIAIQAWSPYQLGFFGGSVFDRKRCPDIYDALNVYAEKYETSMCAVATAFILRLAPDLQVITGSTKWEHIEQALEGEKINMSRNDWYGLYGACGYKIP